MRHIIKTLIIIIIFTGLTFSTWGCTPEIYSLADGPRVPGNKAIIHSKMYLRCIDKWCLDLEFGNRHIRSLYVDSLDYISVSVGDTLYGIPMAFESIK